MPTSEAAKKRVRTSAKKTEINKKRKNKMKTAIKNFEEAVSNKDLELAEERLKEAKKTIDKCASKSILHKNTAARKKSKLDRKFNEISA